MNERKHDWTGAGSFLTALARDVRANTLALMTMALIPLAGMVGGGIDISRMYIVKTRLQHACDAGALAGRKAMGGGTWAQTVKINGADIPNYPKVSAERFFDANFNRDSYGLTSQSAEQTRSFSESAGKVSGTASVQLPMTLMRIFGQTTQTLSVTCDAEMRLPNTDVMFVLDTTGSMGDKAVSTDPDTKIESLKVAVKCFYEIVARLDITDTNCAAGNPSGGTGNEVQIRFGFVPYSVNVNVGRLLPTSYFPNSWDYQTRKIKSITYNNGSPSQTSSTTALGTPGAWVLNNYTVTRGSNNNASDSYCQGKLPGTSTTNGNSTTTQLSSTEYPGYRTVTYKTDTAVTQREYRYNSFSGKVCYFDTRDTPGTTTTNYTRNDTAVVTWTYASLPVDLSPLKNGSAWASTPQLQLQIGNNGTMRTVTWNGCIEERATVSGTSFDPIPSGARDLEVDTVPSDLATQWKPSLGDVEYMRRSGSTYTTDPVDSTSNYSQPDDYCPTEARKMQSWPTASDFETYVDSLTPTGNTYHDIGLLWGARLLSPTGIFRSENEFTPKGGEIERHLIFMTDGDTQTSTSNYAAYGLPWYDRRNVAASDVGSSPGGDMNDEINARFLALCKVVKNQNITLWVISFGSGSNATTENRLSQCASSGRFFTARDSVALQNTFKTIADQISQLRLTK